MTAGGLSAPNYALYIGGSTSVVGAGSAVRTSMLSPPFAGTSPIVKATTVQPGDVIRISGKGVFSTTLNPGNLTLFVSVAGVDVLTTTISNVLVSASGPCAFEAEIFIRGTNAAPTAMVIGEIRYGLQGMTANTVGLQTATQPLAIAIGSSTLVDWRIDVAAQWATGNASNFIYTHGVRLDVVKAS